MPSPAWEDLDDFLDPDEFGVQCVITFQAGGTRAITAIHENPYLNAKAGSYEKDDELPKLRAKETDLVGVRRKDSIVVTFKRSDGTTFTQAYGILTSPQSDGTGFAFLEVTLEP